jgi:hypothetical protein
LLVLELLKNLHSRSNAKIGETAAPTGCAAATPTATLPLRSLWDPRPTLTASARPACGLDDQALGGILR